jgi:DNA-binding transcriptional MerR regulator
MESPGYTINELAELTGLRPRTIHFYIGKGLLPGMGKRGPKTRYPRGHLERLQVIRRLQAEARLTLSEIAAVLPRLGLDPAAGRGPDRSSRSFHLSSGGRSDPRRLEIPRGSHEDAATRGRARRKALDRIRCRRQALPRWVTAGRSLPERTSLDRLPPDRTSLDRLLPSQASLNRVPPGRTSPRRVPAGHRGPRSTRSRARQSRPAPLPAGEAHRRLASLPFQPARPVDHHPGDGGSPALRAGTAPARGELAGAGGGRPSGDPRARLNDPPRPGSPPADGAAALEVRGGRAGPCSSGEPRIGFTEARRARPILGTPPEASTFSEVTGPEARRSRNLARPLPRIPRHALSSAYGIATGRSDRGFAPDDQRVRR